MKSLFLNDRLHQNHSVLIYLFDIILVYCFFKIKMVFHEKCGLVNLVSAYNGHAK